MVSNVSQISNTVAKPVTQAAERRQKLILVQTDAFSQPFFLLYWFESVWSFSYRFSDSDTR